MKKIVSLLIISLMTFSCATHTNNVQNTKLAESHYKLGLAYLNSDSDYNALKEFETALKYNPKDDKVYYAIATFYLKKNMLEKAEENIKKAITLNPKNSEYLNAYASILAAKGNLTAAINEWKKILKDPTYPNIPLIFYNIGYAYFNLKDYNNAEVYFKEAVTMNRFFTAAYLMLYDTYIKMGESEKAEKLLESAVEYMPNNNDVKFRLATHYYKKKSYDKAAELFEEIIIKSPDSPFARKSSKYLRAMGIYK